MMSAQEVPRLILRGERVTLRTPQFQDADRSYKWFADPEVTRYLPLAGKGELPMDAIREFIERVRQEDPSLRTQDLVDLIRERFDLVVHPRTIERGLARSQKKR